MKKEIEKKETTATPADIEPVKFLNHSRIAVNAYDLNGKFIKTFVSIFAAAKELGIQTSSVNMCIHGKMKRSGQYQFRKAD